MRIWFAVIFAQINALFFKTFSAIGKHTVRHEKRKQHLHIVFGLRTTLPQLAEDRESAPRQNNSIDFHLLLWRWTPETVFFSQQKEWSKFPLGSSHFRPLKLSTARHLGPVWYLSRWCAGRSHLSNRVGKYAYIDTVLMPNSYWHNLQNSKWITWRVICREKYFSSTSWSVVEQIKTETQAWQCHNQNPEALFVMIRVTFPNGHWVLTKRWPNLKIWC